MPRPHGVTQTRPPASPVVLRSLRHRQLWTPSWELPLLEHEVGAQCTHRFLSFHRALTWSLSSREDGSKSPGLEVHGMKPTLRQYPPPGYPPSPLPTAPTLPAQALPPLGPRRVRWKHPPPALQSLSRSPELASHGGGPPDPTRQPGGAQKSLSSKVQVRS